MTPEAYWRVLKKNHPDLSEQEYWFLLCDVWGCSRAHLIGKEISTVEWGSITSKIERLAQGEPLAYILGYVDFLDCSYQVSKDVLVPRSDTEWWMATLLQQWGERDHPAHILDLGTGSGVLLLSALRHFPQAKGLGVDIDPGACALAYRNAKALQLTDRASFVESHWLTNVSGSFDLVLCNPPYIAHDDEEVEWRAKHYEPAHALFAEQQGMEAFVEILATLPVFLKPSSYVVFECGHLQAQAVRQLMMQAGCNGVDILHDGAGHQRALMGRWGLHGNEFFPMA